MQKLQNFVFNQIINNIIGNLNTQKYSVNVQTRQ